MRIVKSSIFILLVSLSVTVFAGCMKRVSKNWAATGGSRSDATVRMSYEHSLYEIPEVNEQEALNLARARCKSWGYQDAEAFGGVMKICNGGRDGWGNCMNWLVTKEYQCLGRGDDHTPGEGKTVK